MHHNAKHGHTNPPSRTYNSWASMKQRCKRDPHYVSVTICKLWSNFENFLADMGERPEGMQLDRIDSGGNYEPMNCRWVTLSQQAKNRRPWRRHVDVDRIADLLCAGLSSRAVARHLGYSHTTVNTWRLEDG